MSVGVLFENEIEIPASVNGLESFREWARSDAFPERGRIDYIDGRIEVDLMVEEFFAHGGPKSEIARVVANRVRALQLGHVRTDATRVSSPEASLSAEPDIVVVTHASLADGRVRLIPAKSGRKRRYVELEGSPDLIVEILSDSSVEKDTQRLFHRYFAAGVLEYWLVDARDEDADVSFQIHRRGDDAFLPEPADDDGFQASSVLRARYRLFREDGPHDTWLYTLEERLQSKVTDSNGPTC